MQDEGGELVDGWLVEEEMPDFIHETVVVFLIELFRVWLRSNPRGFVAGSEAKYGVLPTRGRKPDVSVFLPGSRKPPARGLVRVPPDIMVEVVTPTPRDGRRDRVEKPQEYAAFGVRWYWIVDPGLRTLEILELNAEGRYVHLVGKAEGLISDVPGCPGLALDLDALWRELDELEAEA